MRLQAYEDSGSKPFACISSRMRPQGARKHILKRPDSYIGSNQSIVQQMWAYDSDTKRMVLRDVKYVPGFYKIVDEILVNAADNKVRRFT